MSASEVVASIHIVDFFDFLLEKIWIVSKKIADVHWEPDSCNCDGVVWLSSEYLDVCILDIRNITRACDSSVGVGVDEVAQVKVL